MSAGFAVADRTSASGKEGEESDGGRVLSPLPGGSGENDQSWLDELLEQEWSNPSAADRLVQQAIFGNTPRTTKFSRLLARSRIASKSPVPAPSTLPTSLWKEYILDRHVPCYIDLDKRKLLIIQWTDGKMMNVPVTVS